MGREERFDVLTITPVGHMAYGGVLCGTIYITKENIVPSRFDVRPRKNTTDLLIDVDDATVAAAYEYERSAKLLDTLVAGEVFTVEHDSVAALQRYVLRVKAMAKYHDAPRAVSAAYDYLYNGFGEPDETMPVMRMSLDPISAQSSRYGMQVVLRWPECDAPAAAEFATSHMQAFARHLAINGKDSEKLRKELIYAQAWREQGIVLQTNPLGSCSVESDHTDYSDSETVELWQHNIYNREQQLIFLVGAAAFANADRHV